MFTVRAVLMGEHCTHEFHKEHIDVPTATS